MEWSRHHHLETQVTAERLEALMYSTLLTINASTDYTVELTHGTSNVQHLDGLYSRTHERIQGARDLTDKAIDLITIYSDKPTTTTVPRHALYHSRILGNFDNRRVFTLHHADIELQRLGPTCSHVVIQENNYYTVCETNVVKLGTEFVAFQELKPRNDELLDWVAEAFAHVDDSRYFSIPSTIHTALIGNNASARNLEQYQEHPQFGSLILEVLKRAKNVRQHRRTYNPAGPLASEELDQLWQLVFKIQNKTYDKHL